MLTLKPQEHLNLTLNPAHAFPGYVLQAGPSLTKCTSRILWARSCSDRDKCSVRSSSWEQSQNSSIVLDRSGACTISLKDFPLCQGCIKDKAFAWQIRGTFLNCVTLCESLCASISLFIKWRHWYWLLSEVLGDLQAKTPRKVTEIMAVAILKRPTSSSLHTSTDGK